MKNVSARVFLSKIKTEIEDVETTFDRDDFP